MEDETIRAVAEAAKEVAATGGKAIDSINAVGAAFSRFFGPPSSEVSGMICDHLKHIRLERQVRLYERTVEFMRQRGFRAPTRTLPLKLAVPLLEAATLEDDNSLQDVWARMLVNATDINHSGELSRSFIVILEQLSSLEVQMLDQIYELELDDDPETGVLTSNLPISVTASHVNTVAWTETTDPTATICLGLANLSRLGCIRATETFGGGPVYRLVFPTILGKALHSMCSARSTD
ncbi:MAG: Abi-alpha family protein [Pseudomonadota bacterium]